MRMLLLDVASLTDLSRLSRPQRMLSKSTGGVFCPEILGSPAYMSPEQVLVLDCAPAGDAHDRAHADMHSRSHV
jgi:serine/threonine protein kinase